MVVSTNNIQKAPSDGVKKNKKTFKLLIISFFIISLFIIGAVIYFVMNWTEKEKITNLNQYEQYLGADGSHSGITLIESDIFPTNIPESANVEDFIYYYYNPWDPCFCVSLVYTCNDEDYAKEMERLKSINSSSEYDVYGLTGFPNSLCAVNADDYYGIIYALTQEEENRIIYIEITSCNYFNDIDYERFINNEYLPVGFDMTYNNPTQRKEK